MNMEGLLQYSYNTTLNFLKGRSDNAAKNNKKNAKSSAESSTNTSSNVLTRWLRDLRNGNTRSAPNALLEHDHYQQRADKHKSVSISRSQSTLLNHKPTKKKSADCRRYSFNDHSLQRGKRTRVQSNGSESQRKIRKDLYVDITMMPSRSTPNLQQNTPSKLYGVYYDGNTSATNRDADSPPPAPPVRDSSTLKSVKYGPGHEKFPSWPVPSAAETPHALRAPPSGGSHRSKSWTDHTNYPKEKVVTYTRPYMKRQHSSQTQQKLKTVMERCEKITPETYETRYDKINDRLYLPHVDRDGKQLGDVDYMVPSPPERDTCKPQLTQADLEEYARSYQDNQDKFPNNDKCMSQTGLEDFIKYARNYEDSLYPHPKHDESSILMHLHQKQLSYAQSEGYHSYVSSADSTSTPFLDRLRRDSEAVANRHWDDEHENNRREGRDSVVTTSSGSASSSETLKWHGSMSDVSVASSSCTHLASNKQLIAHSARVQTPQRHHSESVLYMASGDNHEGWKDRESRKNNANKLKLFPVNTYTVQENSPQNNRLSNSLSVADRINELEKQQKYSYLDPEKKHKIPDPTLKAIQKKALLSFYERHQTNKTNWRSEPQLTQSLQPVPQPPPRIQVQLPSRRASSASDYASNNASKRSSMASSREIKLTPKHQHSNSCGSLSADLLGPVIVGPSISLDDWMPEKPPERPPKNPHLRTAYPDLFRDQRVPSPDLPPPSPPTVLDEEVFQNDEPLPPPPTELEAADWQDEFQDRLKENITNHQFPSPQVDKRNYINDDEIKKQTVGLPERTPSIKKSAREQLGINYDRTSSRNKLISGTVAVSQKVTNGNHHRAEPMRAQPLLEKKGTKLQQRASFAEGTTKESPPPLQPRQMRINQSMRAKMSENRPAGIALRMSPPKDAKAHSPNYHLLSQSKASYLASRRERERIVPDSDTGSYKRTISPNGHVVTNESYHHETTKINTRESMWSLNGSRTKETILKNNNNNANIIRRASMNDKPMKIEEKEKPQMVLPDVLPVNAKLMNPRYISRPSQLSLAPVEVDDVKKSPKPSPPASPPKSPFNPLRSSSMITTSPQTPPTPPESPKRNSPPEIRPSLSPNTSKKMSPVRSRSSTSSSSSPLKTSPLISPALTPNSSRTPDVSPPQTPDSPKVIEGLQLVQRTEVILRVNACTTDAVTQTEKEEMPPTPMPTRKKLQEEIDCEKLSEDFVNQLPTSAKLKEILVQGPEHKKPTDYVTGLFKLEITSRPRPANSPFSRSRTTTPSSSPPPTNNTTLSTTTICESPSVVPRLEPASPLSATSPYFTTSEPKARFLTRYSQDMNHLNIVKDTKDLSQKKDELVSRLDRKLEVLRSEQVVVSEECRINEELGDNVEMHVKQTARPHEASKFRLHVAEVGKITSLLLSLSGRLARAENALMTMPDDHPERRILESKRDKLLDQLEEAKKLKESIDKRSISVSNILYKYLNSEEYADYDHFINMKAKLLMDSKEIADKIKLGEEQLMALKETLIIES